jgi:hypothetical protein
MTSKPQGRFEGSDRQARGKLMKALTESGVKRADAAAVMGLGGQRVRAAKLVDDLVREGLVALINGYLTLP